MEQDGIWQETFTIHAFMVDRNREATLVTLANIFQEVAGHHAIHRQLGFYDMQAQGMVWVLNRLRIDIERFPKWLDKIVVTTWVSAMQPFSHRHFAVALSDSPSDVIARGYSIWIPLDAQTHRPKRLPDGEWPLVTTLPTIEPPRKLAALSAENGAVLNQNEKIVELSDLDMVNHVNNAKYVEWMLNAADKNGSEKHYKHLEINYLNEVLPNETIDIFSAIDADKSRFLLQKRHNTQEACRAELR